MLKTIDEDEEQSLDEEQSVDKEKILQFILPTIEEQKTKKKGKYKNDIFKLSKERFSQYINEQHFPEYINMLGTKGNVVKKTYSKKGSYSPLRTNEDSDTETINKERQSLSTEMSTFKQFIMAKLLEVKMNRNKNSQTETNIMASEIEINQGKNLIRVIIIKVKNNKRICKLFPWCKYQHHETT